MVRTGDPVAETIKLAREVGADGIGLAADVSAYARRREQRLREECERHRIALRLFPGVTVVDPGSLRPGGGGAAYRVFSPYHRAWLAATWRDEVATPRAITLPDGVAVGQLPAIAGRRVTGRGRRAARPRAGGGSPPGHGTSTAYADLHDDMAADGTSRLSPYLRFGCLSPLAVANAAAGHDAFVRQLCWRDFYYQVALDFPQLSTQAYRELRRRRLARRPGGARALAGRADRGAGRRRRDAPTARRRAGCTTGPG